MQIAHLQRNADYRAEVARRCSILVPEGELKWATLRPSVGRFDFDSADRLVDFARDNSQRVRGHTLVWHLALPDWVRAIETPALAEAALQHHIATVIGRYRGRIASWDVVNEVLSEDPLREPALRNSIWMRLIGEGYIAAAFRAAARADPSAELVLNEYDVERDGERFAAKREALLLLLRRLLGRQVPIHAVGLQCHLRGERGIDAAGLGQFARELHRMGLRMLITELNVLDYALPADKAERDRQVAGSVDALLDTLFAVHPPTAVLTWGLSDRYRWVPPHFKRPDGLPTRSLPLDAQLAPKPFMHVLERYTR